MVAAGDGVRPCLAGLLVHTKVMGIGRESTALASLEIHHVVATAHAGQRRPSQAKRRILRLLEQAQVDAKAGIRLLRAGYRLENQIDWRRHVR